MSGHGPLRGVLFFLAGLMAVSGLIRIGLSASPAAAVTATPPAGPAAVLECPVVPAAMLEAFRIRDEQLRTREAAFEDRMAALTLADQAIAEKLAGLQAAEAALAATIAQADGAAEGDLQRLTAVYEAMKPKEAALLFGAMAPEFAAGFLGRMRPEAAAGVLAGMDAGAAYTISVLLAGRNALAPRD